MYDWLRVDPRWTNAVTYRQNLASKIHRSLWTMTGISTIGALIVISSGAYWICLIVTGLWWMACIATIVFAVDYGNRLKKLYEISPKIIPDKEVIVILRRGISPFRIVMSSLMLMFFWFLPTLLYLASLNKP